MSGILDRIVAAAGAAAAVRVRVPEWDCDLYFTPLTPAERARIRKGIKPDAIEELFIATLQHKARDAEGKPVFEPDPKTRAKLLAHADFGVVTRILREGSVEADPRREMIEAADPEAIRGLMMRIGDADPGEIAELGDSVIEAVRAVLLAREYEIAEALGADPEARTDPIEQEKNA